MLMQRVVIGLGMIGMGLTWAVAFAIESGNPLYMLAASIGLIACLSLLACLGPKGSEL